MKLENINALITGGSQGLGKVIAEHFLRECANVCICARNEQELAATHGELKTAFPQRRVLAKPCDVSNEAQVSQLASFVLNEFGSLQALVLNAGIYGPMGPTESVNLDDWRRATEINLFGVLLPCRALIPHFKKAGRGKIIVISGGGATNPMPNISSYAASKAAVVRLAETLAGELKPFNVDVNAIAPGALKTRLVQQVLDAGPEKAGADFFAKNKKWAQDGAVPLDLGARLVVYLASPESNGVTGKLISAQWDPWEKLHEFKGDLAGDIYTLRRIVPKDRGKTWGDK
ncbi:MAG TPA: SDR family oxidoreductase [Candidatus Acidoferrales bacterium]|jgi:NAD(P)-dependent dehydrogenase (short-subunit alcohol dehydrogenase family)|nr:SDR family oxidoreductase [Candidatus Acidoferrales bacterium]